MSKLRPYLEYKDSGVEWIGSVPKEWRQSKLKRFLDVRNGREIIDEKESDPKVLNVYGSGGVFKKTNHFLYDGESVLFGRKGTIGKPLFVNEKFWTVDTMYYTEIYDTTIPKYIYYLLSIYPWNSIATKTALPSVVGTDVLNTTVSVPPKEEQLNISIFLNNKTSQIDSLIADKERLIELLEEKRQAVITETVTKGLDPNVKMKDSRIEWIGEIPDHWEIKKIKHVSVFIGSGKTPRGGGEVYTSKGIPFLRSMNVHYEGLKLDEIVFINEVTDKEMKSTRVYPEDVLLNITGASIGRTCIVPKDLLNANVNQHVCIIRPSPAITPTILSKLMASQIIQDQIQRSQNGSSREGLNFTQVKNLLFPLSQSIEEQKLISNYIDDQSQTINLIISKVKDQITKLKEYRESIIYEAVTGKIDVRNYEVEPIEV